MRSRFVQPGLSIALGLLVGASACAAPWQRAPAPTATEPVPPIVGQGTRPPAPASVAPLPSAEASTRLHLALGEEGNGRYEQAAAILRALVASGAADDVSRAALLRLGYCHLHAGAYREAADSLNRFLAAYPEDPEAPLARFWLGQALAGAGEGQAAAAAYRGYLEANPLLESYVQERIGDALAACGDRAGAGAAYRAAADAEAEPSRRVGLLEDLAASQRALQLDAEAVSTYDEILAVARIPAYRAEIVYLAGDVLREAGRTAEAAGRWNALVADHPESPYAAQALPLLDGWGLARVDPLTRAQVDYAAGRCDSALAALQRYLRDDPAHGGAAHYYAGLCWRSLGQHQASIGEFEALMQGHPADSLVPDAWYQKGESLALRGAVDAAASTLQQLAAAFPAHARAPQALWRAAQVYEEAGRSWDASAAYVRAAATYPGASYAGDARFRAGLAHYLQQAVQTAATTWADLLPQEKDPALRARLLLWLGKAALRLGDGEGAREWWAQGAAADPIGFWGLRARDLAAGRTFAGGAPAGAFDPTLYAPRGTQAEAEAWLTGWAGPPPASRTPASLPATLTGLDHFRRGLELQRLGELAAAGTELRQILAAVEGPWDLYALSLFCRDQGLFQPSISAADRLLSLAPAAARAERPRLLAELAYPTYYADLVLAEARPSNSDPLLFFALMRQESLFDRAATSRSDARGLTQVIPSTGSYIAGRLDDAAYAPERLWWPAVSVRYGMWYLASALSMFDDDALMALVAYNAGPGNATRWSQAAEGDPDLFFERVTAAEPRAYMRRIYEHRAHYEELYRPAANLTDTPRP